MEQIKCRPLLILCSVANLIVLPTSYHWSLMIPPENINSGFVMFSGGFKETSGMKWIKVSVF